MNYVALAVQHLTGWTFDPTPQIGGMRIAGTPPEVIEELRREGRLPSWAFTDRRPGSPTESVTIYVPAGSNVQQVLEAIEAKTALCTARPL